MRRLVCVGLLCVLLLAVGIPGVNAQYEPVRGILIIPSIGLTKFIQTAPLVEINGVRTNDLTHLGDGVAWLEGTGWINNRLWRMGLAGHNPGAFSRLGELEQGDSVYLITRAGLWRYIVTESYVVDPAATWVLGSSDRPSLVLITCSGDERLVVVAVRMEG
jgi:LPXTG-site transpeptidase (sortase) family protein